MGSQTYRTCCAPGSAGKPSLRPMPYHACEAPASAPITINISASCRDLGVIWQMGCSLDPAPGPGPCPWAPGPGLRLHPPPFDRTAKPGSLLPWATNGPLRLRATVVSPQTTPASWPLLLGPQILVAFTTAVLSHYTYVACLARCEESHRGHDRQRPSLDRCPSGSVAGSAGAGLRCPYACVVETCRLHQPYGLRSIPLAAFSATISETGIRANRIVYRPLSDQSERTD